ncbi:MAG: endonuclease/exonuclease/phosphatase family protein [Bacteroidales bacterium]|nr:endonuclease/exonuclease/phosphatase family protein [Bacteroidales bacterium]MCU0407861.1 endonuclease/exonuclease/phosphatase family protein [Bacteroidales bacterium]
MNILLLLLFAACSGEEESNELKVITFNIRYDNAGDGANAWQHRAVQVASFLNEEKPALLGMQEVLLRQYEYLDSALAGYGSVAVGRNDGAQGGEMNPVFYDEARLELLGSATFWLSETPQVPGSKAWGSSLPRIVTWVKFSDRKTGQQFFMFNTHFAHDSDSARVRSSSMLLSEAERISEGLPFIITGDMNMVPDSRGYMILTEQDNPESLLSDSFVVSAAKPFGPKDTFNGFKDTAGQGRIDYIFVTRGSEVLSHRTIFRKDRGVFISDHWPVIAGTVLRRD